MSNMYQHNVYMTQALATQLYQVYHNASIAADNKSISLYQSAGLMSWKYRSTKNISPKTLHSHCAHPLPGKALEP